MITMLANQKQNTFSTNSSDSRTRRLEQEDHGEEQEDHGELCVAENNKLITPHSCFRIFATSLIPVSGSLQQAILLLAAMLELIVKTLLTLIDDI